MNISTALAKTNSENIAITYGLPDIPANVVYFLTLESKIVYIGKSSKDNFLKRYDKHLKDHDKVFDNVTLIPVDTAKQAYEVEQGLISIIKPKYNRKYPSDKNYYIEIACDYFDMPFDEYLEKEYYTVTVTSSDIQNRIKVVLAERDVMAKDLAKAVDVTDITVSRWVNNKKQPSLPALYKCAEFLKVNVCDLLVGAATSYVPTATSDNQPTDKVGSFQEQADKVLSLFNEAIDHPDLLTTDERSEVIAKGQELVNYMNSKINALETDTQ